MNEQLTQEEIALIREFLKKKEEIEKNLLLQKESFLKHQEMMDKIIEKWKLGEEIETKPVVVAKKEVAKPPPVKKELKASEVFYGMFIKNPEEFREIVEVDKYLVKGVVTDKSARKCYKENLKNEKFIAFLKEKLK